MIVNWPPEMQAMGVIVDVLRAGWMELNDAFLFRPEEVLHKRHFLPVRHPVLKPDGDMLPTVIGA